MQREGDLHVVMALKVVGKEESSCRPADPTKDLCGMASLGRVLRSVECIEDRNLIKTAKLYAIYAKNSVLYCLRVYTGLSRLDARDTGAAEVTLKG